MSQIIIFCTEPVRGTLHFHVRARGEEHWLFRQGFNLSLWERYRGGVPLDDALDWEKSRHSFAGRKVCEKLFKALSYIEKEYGIVLLRKSTGSRSRRGKEPQDGFDIYDGHDEPAA